MVLFTLSQSSLTQDSTPIKNAVGLRVWKPSQSSLTQDSTPIATASVTVGQPGSQSSLTQDSTPIFKQYGEVWLCFRRSLALHKIALRCIFPVCHRNSFCRSLALHKIALRSAQYVGGRRHEPGSQSSLTQDSTPIRSSRTASRKG